MSFFSRVSEFFRNLFHKDAVVAPPTNPYIVPPVVASVHVPGTDSSVPPVPVQAPVEYNLIQYLFDIKRQGEFGIIAPYYMKGDTPADTVARYDAIASAPVVPRQNDVEAGQMVNHGFVDVTSLTDTDKLALQAKYRTDPHFPFRVLNGTVAQINEAISYGGNNAGLVTAFDLAAYRGVLAPYM